MSATYAFGHIPSRNGTPARRIPVGLNKLSSPGCSLENVCKRAQILREELKQLKVLHGGQMLGNITLSVGIAGFPTHATNAETLVKAAADALYRAKKEGRDRIVAAEGEVGAVGSGKG